ncbi:MAG: NAD(P)-dependent oxidoreductase [Planctomycetota bacterium]|nr:NAD(P)-dependent oxidoreductase [Planctomycetota bacterium]MDA1113757.1 NAD(P)-dependent oxidoreductase [Planctomycetota bacterium]
MAATPPDLSPLADGRVLVVGGGGYIASRLIPHLIEIGCELAVQASYVETLKGQDLQVFEGPVANPAIQQAIRDFDPAYVLDLSGRTDQSHSRDNDDAMAESHFAAARHLGRAILDGPSLKRWVHCGSNEEYGNNAVPFTEDMREDPVSAYSVGKVATTHHLKMLADYEKVPVCIVRPFVIYGIGQERGLIPFLIRMAFADQAFDTTEGKQTRDFLWVDDLVDGILAAAVADGVDGEIINLGAGVETPVREVVEMVCRHGGGGQPNFGAMQMREGESQRCVADISKAKRLLGWVPTMNLDEGLGKMVEAARESSAQS